LSPFIILLAIACLDLTEAEPEADFLVSVRATTQTKSLWGT